MDQESSTGSSQAPSSGKDGGWLSVDSAETWEAATQSDSIVPLSPYEPTHEDHLAEGVAMGRHYPVEAAGRGNATCSGSAASKAEQPSTPSTLGGGRPDAAS